MAFTVTAGHGRGMAASLLRLSPPILLAAPLIAFTLVAFALPLVLMLWRAIDNPELAAAMPQSAALLRHETGSGLPAPHVAAMVRTELANAYGSDALGRLVRRLNSERPDARSILVGTARALASAPAQAGEGSLAELQDINPAWAEPGLWNLLRRAAAPLTDHNLLAAIDLARSDDNRIIPVETDSAIYRDAAMRTLVISAVVMIACLALGYPFAFLIANTTGWVFTLLLVCLMLPFWTSLLVRTTAWIVLLQNEGLINKALVAAGIIDAPLTLIRNRAGVIIAMTHVLLPFMVLPLIGIMRAVPGDLMRASAACGARPLQTFLRVYWPLTMPGIAAGGLLVFIQSIGYFITPALVGGPNDQMLGYFVALHTNETLDWGMASALAAILLVTVLVLYVLWRKLAPADGGFA